MTLRKCSFEVKIILTGVALCSATEFINKPLNLHSGAFYISARNGNSAEPITPGLLEAPVKKSAWLSVKSKFI